MKKIFILFIGLFLSLNAFSIGGSQSVLTLISQIVDEVEKGSFSHISVEQQNEVRKNLENTLAILRNNEPGSDKLICKVSSKFSSYFRLFNGKIEIGNDSTQAECLNLRNSSNQDLVCGRSLDFSSYFRVYDIQTGESIGGETGSIENCKKMVKAATRQYVCSVSTAFSSYYSIYNRQTNERIDGDMSLEKCLSSINENPF